MPEQKHYIRIELADVKKHLDHEVEFDSGRASFQGEAYRYEFSLWCKTCQDVIGNSITLRKEED